MPTPKISDPDEYLGSEKRFKKRKGIEEEKLTTEMNDLRNKWNAGDDKAGVILQKMTETYRRIKGLD